MDILRSGIGKRLSGALLFFLAALSCGNFASKIYHQNEMKRSLESVIEATRQDAANLDIDTYSRLVFAMLMAARPDEAKVFICSNQQELLRIPKHDRESDFNPCKNEEKIPLFSIAAKAALNQFSDPVALIALRPHRLVDPISLAVAIALSLIAGLIFLQNFRHALDLKRIERIFDYFEQVITPGSPSGETFVSPKALPALQEKIEDFKTRLRENQDRILKLEQDRALHQLSQQVAHDIRSPLAVLTKLVAENANPKDESGSLVVAAIERINGIANQLLQRPKPSADKTRKSIQTILKNLVREKRIEYSKLAGIRYELELGDPSAFLSSEVSPLDLQTILSNLINNSIESLPPEGGEIKISASLANEKVRIALTDNGSGIPEDLIPLLGKRGISSGKSGATSGSGLGIFHAKQRVELWNGQIKFRRQEPKGTLVQIELPQDAP